MIRIQRISVLGDINGDGLVSIVDISKAYQYSKGRITMDAWYIEAGNVAGNDSLIRINDISKLYQYIKGRINAL